MKYNIGFTLGDPGGDGHACTTDYHIVANHSADEISKAYKETTKLLGFDFIKEVGVDFQSDYWIPEKFTKELLKLGIIDEKYVRESDAEWGAPAGCYEFDYAEEEFVNLYFAIVKYSLPDLEWCSRDLEEETLWDLYGAAYGFMGNRRIPRKIKKALKYAFLYPRVCGRYLRYGAVYTVGRNSKWTRKAAKIRRQMDYAEMINMMTEQLKDLYANSPRKGFKNLDSIFEWEAETKFYKLNN